MLYTVSYDFSGDNNERQSLEAALKATGSAIRCLESTWLVLSDLTAAQIRQALEAVVSSPLHSLVTEVSGHNNAWCLDGNLGVKAWRDQNGVQMC